MLLLNETAAILKKYFISGVLVVVPFILTYIVLKFLFETVDGILQPFIHHLLGYYIPGLGIFSTLLIIILAGVLTRNVLGAWIYRRGDSVLARLPIIRPIYSSAKQLLEAIAAPSMSSFKEVTLIEYPRKGLHALGFISHRVEMSLNDEVSKYAVVFIPSTPTPISGIVVIVPEKEAVTLNMTVEEGIKFLVSGGVASPSLIIRHPHEKLSNQA